jgi:hypothetical protein
MQPILSFQSHHFSHEMKARVKQLHLSLLFKVVLGAVAASILNTIQLLFVHVKSQDLMIILARQVLTIHASFLLIPTMQCRDLVVCSSSLTC